MWHSLLFLKFPINKWSLYFNSNFFPVAIFIITVSSFSIFFLCSSLTLRSIRVAQDNGARVLVLDSADYPGLHPLLAPFVLLVPLQWFTVWSALMRGITDLDERVFMGRRVLATGPDATWP